MSIIQRYDPNPSRRTPYSETEAKERNVLIYKVPSKLLASRFNFTAVHRNSSLPIVRY